MTSPRYDDIFFDGMRALNDEPVPWRVGVTTYSLGGECDLCRVERPRRCLPGLRFAVELIEAQLVNARAMGCKAAYICAIEEALTHLGAAIERGGENQKTELMSSSLDRKIG